MPASAKWRIVLTDRSFVPQGELRNVGGISFLSSLSKLATGSFTVRLDNRHIDRLAACDGYIKLYRDTTLRCVGPIITAEETAQRNEQSLAVTFADQGWILGKRLAGKAATGGQWTTVTDRALIFKAILDALNAESDTGISTATYTLSAGSSITYKAGPYRSSLEVLQELGGALDGFDWRIVPLENWSSGSLSGSKVGSIQAQPLIGTTKNNAVFEYGVGTRSNVLSYSKIRSRDGQANRVFHLGNDPATPVSSDNAAAQTAWGLLEDVVSLDMSDQTLRTKLVQEHTQVRGYPRDLIRMTPHIDPGVTGRLPLPFVDYDIGDVVKFNAVAAGKVRFSGVVRVYAIKINVEQETGFERVELVLEKDN